MVGLGVDVAAQADRARQLGSGVDAQRPGRHGPRWAPFRGSWPRRAGTAPRTGRVAGPGRVETGRRPAAVAGNHGIMAPTKNQSKAVRGALRLSPLALPLSARPGRRPGEITRAPAIERPLEGRSPVHEAIALPGLATARVGLGQEEQGLGSGHRGPAGAPAGATGPRSGKDARALRANSAKRSALIVRGPPIELAVELPKECLVAPGESREYAPGSFALLTRSQHSLCVCEQRACLSFQCSQFGTFLSPARRQSSPPRRQSAGEPSMARTVRCSVFAALASSSPHSARRWAARPCRSCPAPSARASASLWRSSWEVPHGPQTVSNARATRAHTRAIAAVVGLRRPTCVPAPTARWGERVAPRRCVGQVVREFARRQ